MVWTPCRGRTSEIDVALEQQLSSRTRKYEGRLLIRIHKSKTHLVRPTHSLHKVTNHRLIRGRHIFLAYHDHSRDTPERVPLRSNQIKKPGYWSVL